MDHGAGTGHSPLAALRAAADDVRGLDASSSGPSDPMVHADRFEALHDALAAALAGVGDGAQRSSTLGLGDGAQRSSTLGLGDGSRPSPAAAPVRG